MAEKKISDYLPKTEILGQLTEELAEASAAASKLRRKIDGKNPTPKTLNKCWEDLKKEIGDVMNAIDALTEQDPQNYHEFMSECGEYAEPKMERWLSRLQGNENLDNLEKECGGSVFDVTIHCENEQEIDEAPTIDPETLRPTWRNPETDPPKIETEVLILYRNEIDGYGITTAHYEDGSVFLQDSVWYWEDISNWGTYDEERDDYRIPEGWWEYRHFNPDDVYNNKIDRPVVGWMPMPPEEITK